jgi:hypothetical protein
MRDQLSYAQERYLAFHISLYILHFIHHLSRLGKASPDDPVWIVAQLRRKLKSAGDVDDQGAAYSHKPFLPFNTFANAVIVFYLRDFGTGIVISHLHFTKKSNRL